MLRLLVQELKFRRNAMLGWGLGLCFFPMVYIGIYPSVAEEMAGLADLEIYKAMGVSIGTFADWVGSILLFVPLLPGDLRQSSTVRAPWPGKRKTAAWR